MYRYIAIGETAASVYIDNIPEAVTVSFAVKFAGFELFSLRQIGIFHQSFESRQSEVFR
jgi:hypothetical protein